MNLAQLTGRDSLRDVVSNLEAQRAKLYHLEATTVSRSSLARLNEVQPYTLYEEVFPKLLSRCQHAAPRHGFRFKNKRYSLDASTLDLCLSLFPWAKFRTTKGTVKLHVGLDHDGYQRAFVQLSEGKCHEVNVARSLSLPRVSIVVFDRRYTDYAWYNQLNGNNIYFVTRQKKKARYGVAARRTVDKARGLGCDRTITLRGSRAEAWTIPLRRIGYTDPESGQRYVLLTNLFHLSAQTIAEIYKARWQIEWFFKWIKQNLKIKSFSGTSSNAVMTPIRVALCVYPLLAYIKFSSTLGSSLQQIPRLLQLNLFVRRDLMALLRCELPPLTPTSRQTRLQFIRKFMGQQ